MKLHRNLDDAILEAKGLAGYLREPFAICHSADDNTYTVHRRATAETGVHGAPIRLVQVNGGVDQYDDLGRVVSTEGAALRAAKRERR